VVFYTADLLLFTIFSCVPRKKHNTGLKIRAPEAGSFIINDNSRLSVQVLAPNSPTYDDMNDYSIVLRLKYKDRAFLFTGDAENVSEGEMLSKGYDLVSDVLKIGYHGSGSLTTSDFLTKVKPRYAVISVGEDNNYGHPSPDTLVMLYSSNI
jgi:competence protein ComEC